MPHSDEKISYFDRAVKAVKDNPFGYGVLGLIILYAAYWAFTTYLGPMKPGAFLQRTSYDNSIYVLVYPNKNSVKNYYVPGEITRSENGYTIASVTWPNGGYSTFDDCQIYLEKRTSCTISNSKESEAIVNRMVNDKNYLPSVQELLNEPAYYIQLTNNLVSK